jgi:vacuolar-type H+-ATPase subunit I/STV1
MMWLAFGAGVVVGALALTLGTFLFFLRTWWPHECR